MHVSKLNWDKLIKCLFFIEKFSARRGIQHAGGQLANRHTCKYRLTAFKLKINYSVKEQSLVYSSKALTGGVTF